MIEILKKHKLKYKEQKSFKDLKNGALRFDFEVEYNGNSYLIEFDGMQHYSENAQFIKNKKVQRSNFNRLRENDRLKDDYCLTKHIPLLRIKYTLNKDEIEKQILEFLKKNYKNMGG